MKLTRTIPARTETFEITWCKSDFLVMSPKIRAIRTKRKDKGDHCWWCSHQFEDGDQIGLIGIKGRLNKLLCQDCVLLVQDSDREAYDAANVSRERDENEVKGGDDE